MQAVIVMWYVSTSSKSKSLISWWHCVCVCVTQLAFQGTLSKPLNVENCQNLIKPDESKLKTLCKLSYQTYLNSLNSYNDKPNNKYPGLSYPRWPIKNIHKDSVCEFSTAPEARPKHLASGNLDIHTTLSCATLDVFTVHRGWHPLHMLSSPNCRKMHQVTTPKGEQVSRWASDVKLKALNVWDKTRNVTKSEVSNLLQTWHFKLTCEMLRCWLIWLQFCIATNLRRGVRSVASYPGAGFKVGSQKDIDIAMNLCSKVFHAHRVQSSPVDESVLTSHGCIPEFQRWPKSFEDL